MKGFIQSGDVLDLTAPVGGVVSGGVYLIGEQILAVASIDAAAGAPFAGKVTGVFGVTKVGSQAWAVGEPVYWDDDNARFTTDPTGGFLAGYVVQTADAADTTGVVRLDTGARADSRPALVKGVAVISASAYGNAFSVPITLVPAVTGSMIIPEAVHVVKAAGSAWTPGAGELQIASAGSGTTLFTIAKAGFFDQTAAKTAIGTQTSFASYNATVHALDGTALVLRLITANMTGGSGDLTVTFWYRVWGVSTP